MSSAACDRSGPFLLSALYKQDPNLDLMGTLEEMYELPAVGQVVKNAIVIAGIWK
jgi:hypothetical protein